MEQRKRKREESVVEQHWIHGTKNEKKTEKQNTKYV